MTLTDSKDLNKSIRWIQQGDELMRERLIQHYRPYIMNIVGHVCKRYVTWSEEEASVGLIAFNKAIDSFIEQQGRTFHSYAYLLIKRDLVDYFKYETKRDQPLSLDIEEESDRIDQQHAVNQHFQSLTKQELVDEIMEFDQQLQHYSVSLEELEHFAPKHVKTLRNLQTMAFQIAQTPQLIKELIERRRLPIAKIASDFNYKYKTIEKHRKYLIALVLIYYYPGWAQLKEFVIHKK